MAKKIIKWVWLRPFGVWCTNENQELNKIGWVTSAIKSHSILIEWACFAFIDRMENREKGVHLITFRLVNLSPTDSLSLSRALGFQIKCTTVIASRTRLFTTIASVINVFVSISFLYCCEMCPRKRCNKIHKMYTWYLIWCVALAQTSSSQCLRYGWPGSLEVCFFLSHFFETLWLLAQPSHKK